MNIPLKSGRKVAMQQFILRQSTLGILEGNPSIIRSHVLKNSKDEAERIFGPGAGFLLIEPADGHLPMYQIFVDLLSYTPINDDFDCSALICSWFDDATPDYIEEYIKKSIQGIDWEDHAKDANY
jgi:hypothetical protein